MKYLYRTIKYFVIVLMAFQLIPRTPEPKIVNPPALFDPTPYGFSHVVTVPSDAELIFVAGQGGEKNGHGTLSDDFRTQVRQAMRNIAIALASQHSEMTNVVKVTTLVVDHDAEKLAIIADEFKRTWPKSNLPVNTLIPVPRLALDGMMVEIDATAMKNR